MSFRLLKLKPHLLLIISVLNIRIGAIEFFAFNTKLPEMTMLHQWILQQQKNVTASGARLADD